MMVLSVRLVAIIGYPGLSLPSMIDQLTVCYDHCSTLFLASRVCMWVVWDLRMKEFVLEDRWRCGPLCWHGRGDRGNRSAAWCWGGRQCLICTQREVFQSFAQRGTDACPLHSGQVKLLTSDFYCWIPTQDLLLLCTLGHPYLVLLQKLFDSKILVGDARHLPWSSPCKISMSLWLRVNLPHGAPNLLRSQRLKALVYWYQAVSINLIAFPPCCGYWQLCLTVVSVLVQIRCYLNILKHSWDLLDCPFPHMHTINFTWWSARFLFDRLSSSGYSHPAMIEVHRWSVWWQVNLHGGQGPCKYLLQS